MRKITRLRSGNKSRLYYIFGIVALCAFVSIGIGYSILTSTVRVDGTASITSTWRVVFTKAVENTMQGATTTAGPSITGGTTLDIGVELNEKGSQAIYDVTVENQGTIDSYVKEIRLNDGEPTDLKVYISGIYKGFSLKAGESKQFQVIAEWSASAPESSETEKDVNVSIDFEQETEDSVKPELSMPTYTVDYPNEVWTREKNVTMTYPEGENLLYQYSTDGGKTWLIAPSIVYVLKFTQNGTLYIRVSDGVSVLTTPLITIEKIDTDVPTVNISGNSSTWETSKTLTIHASDQESGLASNPYSWDGGKSWTSVKEKEFTSNQTVNIWVKDNAENVNKQSITISKIDQINPEVNITGNTSEWTTSKMLTIEATDNGDLASLPYSWDGGKSWTTEKSKTYTSNQTVNIWVKDSAGNITKNIVEILKIDAVSPTANITGNNDTWTTSKILTITASDKESGLASNSYSWDGGKSWTNVKEKEFTSNQTINIWVKDNVGNINKQTITISKIDNVEPMVQIIGNDPIWTNSKTLTVIAQDTDSGLPDKAYSFDGGKTWTDATSMTFTEMKTVNVWVKDNVGNINKQTIVLNQIDVTAPTVNIGGNNDTWTTSKTLTIAASDTESGLASNPYSWDGGKSWTTEKSKTYTSNQTVSIWVKDNIGNVMKTNVVITKIDTTKPTTVAPTATSTTNSITVVSKQTDGESGIKTIQYALQKEGVWSSYQSSNIFHGLTHNTSYVVKTKVIDQAGNASESAVYTIRTKTLTAGSLTLKIGSSSGSNYTQNTWINQSVYVSLNKASIGTTTYESIDGSAQSVTSGTTETTIINANGITKLRVKTTDGFNIVYSSSYIIKKDSIVPEVQISGNSSTWTASKTLTITASDTESGLASNPYSWDGGKSWTTEKSKTYTSNQTINIWVKDNVGNITKNTVQISKIDTTVPTVNITGNSSTWTTSKTLTITVSDTESGLASSPYSWDGGKTWTTEKSKIYTSNQTINIWVKDNVGNITKNTVQISKIDTVAPTVNITGNNDTWTTSKTLTINASDKESGLVTNPYSWDGGKTWTSVKEKKFTSNQTVNIWVKDNAGNINKQAITISKIDRTNPEVTITGNTTEWTTSKTLTIDAKDNGILDSLPYSWDGGKSWTTEKTKQFTSNQTVNIWVKDKAGNIYKTSVAITKIDAIKPTAPTITNSSNGKWTADNVVVTLKSTDNDSGIDHYEWYENNAWTTRAISMSGGVGTITYTADRNLTIRFRAIDKAGNISSEATTVVKKDSTSPSNVKLAKGAVTSSSITVSASATANPSGIRGYQFQLNNGSWSSEQTGTTKTFTGLTKNMSYSIKVRVYSNNGKYTEGSLSVTTFNISAPTYSVVTNTSGTKTVTITYNGTKTSNLVYEYSLDGGKTWKTVSGTSQKVEFIDAGTVVARVRDTGNSNNTVTASTFQVTFPINYLKDNLYLGSNQEVSFVNYLAPSNVSHTDVSLAKDDSIQMWTEDNVTYLGSRRKIVANEDSSYLFSVNISGDQAYRPPEIMSIEFNDWLDTSHVKNMTRMFSGFIGTELDLSSFDTSSVTNMSSMFYEVNLETIDLSNFDTKKVTTMESMFAQSWNLKHLTIPFDSTSLENVRAMFRWCDMLETIDFGYNFNMENVTDMSKMFQLCPKLNTYIEFTGTKVTNYTDFAKSAFTEEGSMLMFHIQVSSIPNAQEVTDLLSKIVESANNVNIRMTAS